jgi:hypothetical protein
MSPQTSQATEITVGTDAAYAPPGSERARRPLRNISEVRHFFRTNEVPIYFVGATPFNLLGLDRWVRNFSYVTYYDGWDGAHPRVFTPRRKPYIEFESGEEINNWPTPQDSWKLYSTLAAFDAINAEMAPHMR